MIRLMLVVSVIGSVGCGVEDTRHTKAVEGNLQQELPTSATLSFNALTGNALTGNALTGNALTGNALTGNALTGNALTGNALTGNALTGNALTGNALTGNGVTTGQQAREVFRYIYSCAMPAGKRLTLTLDGEEYNFDGAIGLAPQWETGTCDESCQRWISACLLARTNAFGVPVPISIRGNHPALANVSQAEKDRFSLREGSYYGNVFDNAVGRNGCTGPASNEPALTERLCSNGGIEGDLASPCRITVFGECFVPEAERSVDPVFGSNLSLMMCAPTLGPNGDVQVCKLHPPQSEDPPPPIEEVITVYLQQPEPLCGNGVCEVGETNLTCGDCSLGWAKSVADPMFIDPTAGAAADPRNDELVIAGKVSGGAPDLGGGPLTGDGGLFLARYTNAGAHVASKRIGTGDVTPTEVAVAADGSVFVAGRYGGDETNVGGSNLSPSSTVGGIIGQRGFVAKFSPAGAFAWSVSLAFGIERLVLDGAGDPVVAGNAVGKTAFVRLSAANGTAGAVVSRDGSKDVAGLAVDAGDRVLISDDVGTTLYTPTNVPLWSQPKLTGNLAVGSGQFYVATESSVEGWSYTTVGTSRRWAQPMMTEPLIFTLTQTLDKLRDLVPEIELGSDGNLVVGGSFTGRLSIGRFTFSITSSFIFEKGFVTKLSSDGVVLWAQQLASPVSSTVSGFALDRAGGILLAGRFQANVVIDGFALTTPRQNFRSTASEMFLAKVRDQLVNQQPNDRAGGAISIPASGDGLTVELFDDINLTVLRGTSIDPTPRLHEVPPAVIEPTSYSIRWSGVIESDITEQLTFHLGFVGGVRLFIDDQPVIDSWTDQRRDLNAPIGQSGIPEATGTFDMVAHRRHKFRLEYFNVEGDGFLSASWGNASQKEQSFQGALTSSRTRVFTGSTVGLADDYQASCGGGARGADAVYKLRVDEPTRIRALATGNFTPVLHIRDGSSTAGEVACSATSGVDVTVGPGSYLVIVDGQAGVSGNYQLGVTLEAPAANDLDADATFVSDTARGGRFYGSTTGYADNHTGSCGGAGQADAVYRVVLATPRQLRANTDGSDFDTVLYVTSANGAERACSDDVNNTKQSAVDVTLPAGTHYLHVDGKGGSNGVYRVDVNLGAPRNEPPTADAGSDLTATCVLPGGSADFVLDASASSDPDGDTLSFVWAQGATPIATSETANVSLPVGTHGIDLTVDDGFFTATDRMSIAVIADTAPPTFAPAADVSVTATTATGSVLGYPAPVASDDCDIALDVTCAPASGTKFPLGTTTVTCTTRDDAGNVASTTFKGSVIVSASSLLSPVNTDGSSVFKKGSTIPLKFVLTGASAGIIDLTARVLISKVSNQVIGDEVEAVTTVAASTGNLFRYDTTSSQYIFNLGTKGLSVGTYQVRIDLGDGVQRVVLVSIN